MALKTLRSRVAGVTFEGRQDVIATLYGNELIQIRPEPENPHDPNALAVWVATQSGPRQVGYVPRQTAEIIAPHLEGENVIGRLVGVTGGTRDFPTFGLVVEFEVRDEQNA